MPRVFKMGPYLVYFWSDEREPLEPVHVHISIGSKKSASIASTRPVLNDAWNAEDL